MAIDILSIILWAGIFFVLWLIGIAIIKPIYIFIYYKIKHVKGYASYYTLESVYSTAFMIFSVAILFLSFIHCGTTSRIFLGSMCTGDGALLSRYSVGYFMGKASAAFGAPDKTGIECRSFLPDMISDRNDLIAGSGAYPDEENPLKLGFQYSPDTPGECHKGSSVGENVNYFYCTGVLAEGNIRQVDSEGVILSDRDLSYAFDLTLQKAQGGSYRLLNATCGER